MMLSKPHSPARTSANYSRQRHEDLTQNVGLYTLQEGEAKFNALDDLGLHRSLIHHVTNYVCQTTTDGSRCPTTEYGLTEAAFTSAELLKNTIHGMLSKFLLILNDIGAVASVIVCIYLITGLLRSLVAYLVNLHRLKVMHGCILSIFRWAWPEVMANRTYQTVMKNKEPYKKNKLGMVKRAVSVPDLFCMHDEAPPVPS